MKSSLLKLAVAAAVLGLTTSAAFAADNGNGVQQNPYSPQANGHSYRHGAVPTRETKARMDNWNREFHHNGKAFAAGQPGSAQGQLSYGGGTAGSQGSVGVLSGQAKVYLVFYGNQWGTSSTDANGNLAFSGDSYGAASAVQQMFKGIGTNGETWQADLTQWCDGSGVASGATSCPSSGVNFVPYQQNILAGVWYDNTQASPASATGHQLGAEALAAAHHFGNTTSASNRYAYYVILSPHGTNPDNYQSPTQGYCAWHDWNGDTTLSGGAVTSDVGDFAFSNQPYNMDMGSSCGVGFVNGSSGNLDGWTMTLGHEWHEMMSDQYPAGGWTNHTGDATYNGQENSDECAWIAAGQTGGAANIAFSTGTFAEQASWSNDTANCSISHAILTHGGGGGGTPTASFTVATSGLTATFTDTSTDSGGTIGSHSWNFGDGSTSTATSPSHTYAAAGTYTVTETVADSVNTSATNTATKPVTVSSSGGGGGGTAAYNSTYKAPACTTAGSSCDSGTLLVGRGAMSGGAEPNQPNTINNSCADGGSGTFHSDESNDRIVIASTDGTNLTAGKSAKVTATVWAYDSSSDSLDLYYAANASSPTWTLITTIKPTAAGAQSLSATFTLPTGSMQAVRAHFRYLGSAASACSTGSYDESDDLVFAVGGGSAGGTPTANFTSTTSGLTATFTDTSTDSGGTIGSYSWNFGDSTTSTTKSPSHTYAAAGTYSVTETVTDSVSGKTSSKTASVTVASAGGTPTANFTFTTSGLTATFTDSSTDSGGTIGSYSWNFGDSTTSTTKSPSHTYAAAGTYSVTETVTDSVSGKTSSKTSSVTVSSGSTPTQLLVNSGIESSLSPWSGTAGIDCSTGCSGESAHTGSGFAWLDGYGTTHTDTLSQTVTIPAGKTTGTLTFWLHIDTAETGTTAYDVLTVKVGSTTVGTFSNVNAASGYQSHSFNVPVTAGSSVQILFSGTEDSSNQTSFVIDDVTFTVQ